MAPNFRIFNCKETINKLPPPGSATVKKNRNQSNKRHTQLALDNKVIINTPTVIQYMRRNRKGRLHTLILNFEVSV